MTDFVLTLIVREVLRVLQACPPGVTFEEVNQLPYNGIADGVAFAVKLRATDGQCYTHLDSITIFTHHSEPVIEWKPMLDVETKVLIQTSDSANELTGVIDAIDDLHDDKTPYHVTFDTPRDGVESLWFEEDALCICINYQGDGEWNCPAHGECSSSLAVDKIQGFI